MTHFPFGRIIKEVLSHGKDLAMFRSRSRLIATVLMLATAFAGLTSLPQSCADSSGTIAGQPTCCCQSDNESLAGSCCSSHVSIAACCCGGHEDVPAIPSDPRSTDDQRTLPSLAVSSGATLSDVCLRQTVGFESLAKAIPSSANRRQAILCCWLD